MGHRISETCGRVVVFGSILTIITALTAPAGAQTVFRKAPQSLDTLAASAPASPASSAGRRDTVVFDNRGLDTDTSSPKADTGDPVVAVSRPHDFNRDVYYKNRLEFSLESGLLNQNIPFPFDVFMGDGYNSTSLNYTLVPVLVSLRWQLGDVHGPKFLRGNFDATFSAVATPIPRGPENHFVGYAMGIRRNFVPRNFHLAPYFEFRAGTGGIDAKGPKGVVWAQGQNFVFTLMMGSGFRYNISPRYALSAGVSWMHISNLYMSEPKYDNYGINVYGPMFGLEVRVGKHRPPDGAQR